MNKLGLLMMLVITFFAGAVSASALGDLTINQKVVSYIDGAHEQQQAY
jgi:hypothetical protein